MNALTDFLKHIIPLRVSAFSTLTCHELPHFRIHSLSKETEQCWDTPGVPNSDLVVIHSFAIHEVPQSATGVPLDFKDFVV